jgi:uridine phosphorylase
MSSVTAMVACPNDHWVLMCDECKGSKRAAVVAQTTIDVFDHVEDRRAETLDNASFPNFRGKHAHDALFTPKEYIGYARRQGFIPDFVVPEGLILCYSHGLLDRICSIHATSQVGGVFGAFYLLDETAGRVGVGGKFGIGAPAVTTVLEEFIALGVNRFISIGTAGTLASELSVGDVVLCERAIRDEGVSHHYLEPAKYAEASTALTNALGDALAEVGVEPIRGTSWTIDTPYRETVAEARHYQQEGVLAVEMEAAALFAVAQYRHVEVASALVVSDSLAELVWDPQFHDDRTRDNLDLLFTAAMRTLA